MDYCVKPFLRASMSRSRAREDRPEGLGFLVCLGLLYGLRYNSFPVDPPPSFHLQPTDLDVSLVSRAPSATNVPELDGREGTSAGKSRRRERIHLNRENNQPIKHKLQSHLMTTAPTRLLLPGCCRRTRFTPIVPKREWRLSGGDRTTDIDRARFIGISLLRSLRSSV